MLLLRLLLLADASTGGTPLAGLNWEKVFLNFCSTLSEAVEERSNVREHFATIKDTQTNLAASGADSSGWRSAMQSWSVVDYDGGCGWPHFENLRFWSHGCRPAGL